VILSLQPHDAVFADKFKMDQVVRNLVSNALKFTPKGGQVTLKASFVYDEINRKRNTAPDEINREIATSSVAYPLGEELRSTKVVNHDFRKKSLSIFRSSQVEPARNPDDFSEMIPGKLVIVVTDTGAGISVENQKRLFNEVIQFNPEKLQAGGGSGLGLWITSGIMNLHEGKVFVFSDGEGKGSSFTIEIPMTRPIYFNPQAVPKSPFVPDSLSVQDSNFLLGHLILHHQLEKVQVFKKWE
jgi:signal transduction histidine kinase